MCRSNENEADPTRHSEGNPGRIRLHELGDNLNNSFGAVSEVGKVGLDIMDALRRYGPVVFIATLFSECVAKDSFFKWGSGGGTLCASFVWRGRKCPRACCGRVAR